MNLYPVCFSNVSIFEKIYSLPKAVKITASGNPYLVSVASAPKLITTSSYSFPAISALLPLYTRIVLPSTTFLPCPLTTKASRLILATALFGTATFKVIVLFASPNTCL